MSILDKSRLKAKIAIEKLYEDTCNIYTCLLYTSDAADE